MSFHRDRKPRLSLRQAVVSLVVAASAVTADLAGYGGNIDASRMLLLGLAGLFAGVVAGLTLKADEKKFSVMADYGRP
jgi:hypothetical protein